MSWSCTSYCSWNMHTFPFSCLVMVLYRNQLFVMSAILIFFQSSFILCTFFFFMLRLCSIRCWVRLTSSYGPSSLPVVDIPAVNFQHVCRQIVLPGVPRLADRSLPNQHPPSACIHTTGTLLSFHMSMTTPTTRLALHSSTNK